MICQQTIQLSVYTQHKRLDLLWYLNEPENCLHTAQKAGSVMISQRTSQLSVYTQHKRLDLSCFMIEPINHLPTHCTKGLVCHDS